MKEDESKELQLDRLTFDRLVDGALSPAEYRRVLLALEEQPAAWRLCAEAFLEAQAWRSELCTLRQHSVSLPVEAKPTLVAAARQSSVPTHWLSMSLVALVSFALAFAVAGWAWQTVNPLPIDEPSVNNPDLVAETPHESGNQPTVPTTYVSHQPFGKVQLPVTRGANEEPGVVDVPVFERSAAAAVLTNINSRPALPEDLLQSLEAKGHQVDLERRFIPVTLEDGRQLMLPVEGYRIIPGRLPSY